MFRNAKVGDTIWDSWKNEDVVISTISHWLGYSISLTNGCCLTTEGYDNIYHKNPRYFWQRFEFPKQERPKQKVKKVIEGWLNFYKDNNIVCLHATKEKAIGASDKSVLGEPKFVSYEYFVEE